MRPALLVALLFLSASALASTPEDEFATPSEPFMQSPSKRVSVTLHTRPCMDPAVRATAWDKYRMPADLMSAATARIEGFPHPACWMDLGGEVIIVDDLGVRGKQRKEDFTMVRRRE